MMKSLVLFLVSLLAVALLQGQAKPLLAQPRLLWAPPQQITYMALGYNEALADLLWLRLIQDMTMCHADQYHNRDIDPLELAETDKSFAPKACKKGWAFQVLDAITELAPDFLVAYKAGAINLSVLGEDKEGAQIIFNKGLRRYPKNWEVNYFAAYHYLHELNQVERAAELFYQAGINGAPGWVVALAAKLHSQSGRFEAARQILRSYLAMDDLSDAFRSRVEERLAEVESQMKQQ